jgi:hypothetical protein
MGHGRDILSQLANAYLWHQRPRRREPGKDARGQQLRFKRMLTSVPKSSICDAPGMEGARSNSHEVDEFCAYE